MVMEFSFFSARVNLVVVLLVLNSPCKLTQSLMDFGPLSFLQTTDRASLDFGRITFNSPSAVLRPRTPRDIALLLSFISASSHSKATVAARGAAHSIHGQAQAVDGIVVEMESLSPSIEIHRTNGGGDSYEDVSGGVLWIELLEETLKVGLAPRSWTDYLYLSIGGTLSNGGISGQTFKYGPQISNVLQLDVVTGTGELVTCSPTEKPELFHAVLGGLGQFGIITRARILLQDAPHKVRWVRAFYDDFETFTKDQELLVAMPDLVDYVEGFMVLNEESLHSSSIAFPAQMDFSSALLQSGGGSKVHYCLEFAIHHYQPKEFDMDQVVVKISDKLSFMPTHMYSAEVSFYDFLNRVRLEEMSLRRSRGLWDVAHPWLNMFVPKSGIARFNELLMESISPQDFEGPILIYPMLKDKWDRNTSAVLPEAAGNVMYIVGMLQSANPATCSSKCLQERLRRNRHIAKVATASGIGAKQYLANHQGQDEWRKHFGGRWDRFVSRKNRFDPLRILAPGQNIFQRRYATGTGGGVHGDRHPLE